MQDNREPKKFFLDTEFYQNGEIIDLISVGVMAEDGAYYYAVNLDAKIFNLRGTGTIVTPDEWLKNNVLSQLPELPFKAVLNLPPEEFIDTSAYDDGWRTKSILAEELLNFFAPYNYEPIIWADYSAYDHVALCQIFGDMTKLPQGMPMHTRDLRTVIEDLRLSDQDLPPQKTKLHHALNDAAWNMELYYFLRNNFVHPSLIYGELETNVLIPLSS